MCYASTYLGAWETQLFQKVEKTPFTYYRYIDDIWGIWTHGKEELIKFHKTANSIHQNIQVDLRFSSNEKIEFLDVYTSIQNGSVKTEVYSKPSDKHLYLHVKSDHPFSMKKSIPYGLGIRAKRICSDEADYRKEKENIKKRLVKRGYKKEDIDEQLGKVDQQKREDLLEYRQNTQRKNKRVPLVVTHSRALPDIRGILRKHQNILMRSDRLQKAFEHQPLLALRRDKNLQDILVHKKHNKMFFNQKQGCHKCDRKKCMLCPRLLTGDEFWDENGNAYKVKSRVTCLSENLVYAVFCTQCNKFIYVGETGDTLYQRMSLNFSRIRTGRDDQLCNHFREKGHSVEHFKVMGIEKLHGNTAYRRTIERLWKKKLNTYKPRGLNTQD